MRIVPSINKISSAVTSLRYGLPALNSVAHDLRLHITDPVPFTELPLTPFQELSVKGLRFAYPNSDWALEVGELTIRRGERIAFAGQSGSGKTTCVDLLIGMHLAQSGQILVNGEDLHSHLEAWRSQLAYVSQIPFLIDDTIRHNVAFDPENTEPNEQRLRKALDFASLSGLVDSLPDGAEAEVGDRGTCLSGGQRQRVTIARAHYRNPMVYIIDEGTSALDTVTESEFVKRLAELGSDKTVIMIAHRLSTLTTADRIYFFVDGRIHGVGTYDELLRNNPRFAAMVAAGELNGKSPESG